jgi:4-hydroxy-3-methylbut-2-enyl diphosphate reductase
MLATQTREIAAELRRALSDRYGAQRLAEHFADTSDTLCYATNENQNATYALVAEGADLALVVGGYNSSNTSHLVELCAREMPTYFVSGADDLISPDAIRHFSLERRAVEVTTGWLPGRRPLDVVLTCGASCPDAILDQVLKRLLGMFDGVSPVEDVLAEFLPMTES